MNEKIQFTINLDGNVYTGLAEIDEAMRKVNASASSTFKLMDRFSKASFKVSNIIGGINNISQAFNALTGTSLEFEQQQANLKTLLNGDADATKNLVNQIREYGKATVYDRSGLIEAQKTMMAFGLNAEFAFGKLKNIGDIALGDSQKMQSLSLAFAQATSTGKLMGQDFLQMVNAGFNPLEVISQKTGKSMAQLKDEMSKGQISAEMLAQAFQWATEEGGRFYNGAETAAQTTAGRIAKMKDTIDEMKISLFEATGGATAYIAEFGKIIEPLVALDSIFKGIGVVIKWCTKNFNGFIKSVKKGIVVAMFQLESLKFSIGATGGFFKALAVTAKVSCKAIGSAIKSIPVIGWILAAISAVIALFKLLWDKCEGFRRVVFGVWEVVKTGFSMVLNLIQPLLSKLWEYIKSCATYIMSIPSKIGEAFSIAWNFVVDTFTAAFDWILEKLGSIGSWIGEKIIQPMRDMFAGLWEFVKGILDKIVGFVGEIFNPIIELWNKLTGNVVNAYLRGAEKGSESWRKDQQEKLVPGFGINEQLQKAVGGTTGSGTGTNKNSATGASTEAVATGGTRSTNVTITLKNLVEKIVFEGTTQENRSEIERNLAEAMFRVLNIAQSSVA